MNKVFLYTLLLTMTIVGSFGGYFFKRATNEIEKKQSILKCVDFYIGGGLYFFSALINIYILKYLPYVIVLPMTGITYIWTLIISNKFLKENISNYKKTGVLLIILGSFFLIKM